MKGQKHNIPPATKKCGNRKNEFDVGSWIKESIETIILRSSAKGNKQCGL